MTYPREQRQPISCDFAIFLNYALAYGSFSSQNLSVNPVRKAEHLLKPKTAETLRGQEIVADGVLLGGVDEAQNK
jgi:hypothetical protein